jgi:hypothetical protein
MQVSRGREQLNAKFPALQSMVGILQKENQELLATREEYAHELYVFCGSIIKVLEKP